MFKRFLTFLLIGIMFCIPIDAAAESKLDTAVRELISLDVLEEDEISAQKLEEPITRAEFSRLLVRLMDLSELEESMNVTGIYSDVSIYSPYCRSIELLSQLGLISGTGQYTFSPDSYVTLEQASKMVTCALGYSVVAKNAGGWPSGYLNTAIKIGLLDDIKSSREFNYGQLLILLHNALDVDMVVSTAMSPSNTYYEVSEGETLRLKLMTEATDTAYKLSGVVSATAYSYTVLQIPDLENDEVVIDNVIYRMGNTKADRYFGQKVDFYAVERNDEMLLISVAPSLNNKVYRIESEDLNYFNQNSISYKNENGKNQTINTDDKCCFLYNGTPVRKENLSKYSLGNGFLDVIDNDNDKTAEIVQIWEYVDIPIDEIKDSMFKFKTGYTLFGASTFFFDEKNEEKKFVLIDENGKYTTPENLGENVVISVFANEDRNRFTIYASENVISGKIQSYDDKFITVNEQDYGILQDVEYDFNLGDDVIIYLNYFDKISYIEKTEETGLYGFVSYIDGSSISRGTELEIVVAADVSFSSEEKADANDVYATNAVPVLVCSNSGVNIYQTAEKVKVNGKKVKTRDLKSYISEEDVIFFKTDSEGKITSIDILEMCAGSKSVVSKYDVYDKVFGGPGIQNGIALDENTKVLAIPQNGATCEEDYMVKTVVRADDNYAGHIAQGYEYNSLTKKVKLVAVTKRMRASDVVLPYLSASKPTMVLGSKYIYNEESDEYDKVFTLLENGETKTLVSEDVVEKNMVLGNISEDDLIIYVENMNGKIANAIKLTSIKNQSTDINRYNSNYNYTELSGMITETSINDIDVINYRLVNTVILNVNGNDLAIKFPVRKSIPVYMYDNDFGEVTMSSLDAIIPGYDRLYVVLDGSDSPLACVIIRD